MTYINFLPSVLGSISSGTGTGSDPFSPLIFLDATILVLLSVFTLTATICQRICSKSRPKSSTSQLPVDVHGSKTSLLKLPVNTRAKGKVTSWTPRRKCFVLLTNSLNWFFKKLYGGQFGEILCWYCAVKGYEVYSMNKNEEQCSVWTDPVAFLGILILTRCTSPFLLQKSLLLIQLCSVGNPASDTYSLASYLCCAYS